MQKEIQTGYAVGLKRPPRIFFFDLDCACRKCFVNLRDYSLKYFKFFSIYKSKHGFHLIALNFKRRYWKLYKRRFKTDYTLRLRPRWGNKRFSTKSMVIRISEKWNKEGKVISFKPRKIFGNFELINVEKWKIIYGCKLH